MAKRKRKITENTIKRKNAQQRGLGRLSDYKPWHTIQDKAKNSLVTRVRGWKTGRVHQILSLLKLKYFYLLEWSSKVVDIREQFPLDQVETAAVAEELGNIRLADQINSGNYLCADFLITVRDGFGTKEIARTVIDSNFLKSKSLLNRLEIERKYWAFRNIDWGIVTEKNINLETVKNIEWLHPFLDISCLYPLTKRQINEAEGFLFSKIKRQKSPLRNITSNCDKALNLGAGSSLSIVRYLLANKRIDLDISVPIQPAQILKIK